MKKLFIFLIIFLVVCMGSDSIIKNSILQEIDNRPPYYLSFASIGANLLESRLDCWAKIKTVNTIADMDQTLITVLHQLELPAYNEQFRHQSEAQQISTQYNLEHNGQNYLFIIQSNPIQDQSYFVMTVVNKQNYQQLIPIEEKMKSFLDCTSYYRFKGNIGVRCDTAARKELLEVVMKTLQAENNDFYSDGQVISMTGFSQVSEKNQIVPVQVAGKKANVQAAIRGNTIDNTTEVYLGFPLLLNDY